MPSGGFGMTFEMLNSFQFPYPCIGAFRFLDMSIAQSPLYPEILDRLKSGEKLLDVGCAVGQELRQLVRLVHFVK
jgi:2-polyprenyl-3-methyl-5-hydroxy-6-metoxy-1,4-benzoquinol methylase